MNKRGQTDIYKILLFSLVGIILIAGIIFGFLYLIEKNKTQCGEGGKLDVKTNTCVYLASKTCEKGFIFNAKKMVCEKQVENIVDCNGIFNKTTGICSIAANESYVCSLGVLTQINGNWSCVVNVDNSAVNQTVVQNNTNPTIVQNNTNQTINGTTQIKPILVTIRIDDPLFRTDERVIIENILSFAKRNNVKVDLGVIAKPFDEMHYDSVFKIYEDNRDFMEIIAHGYTHTLLENYNYPFNEYYQIIYPDHGEFGGKDYNFQKTHVDNMYSIFEKYGLETAKKIFVTPYWSNDNNTIRLAESKGYKLIMSGTDPRAYYLDGNVTMISSEGAVVVASSPEISNQISGYNQKIEELIEAGIKNIVIVAHTFNFAPGYSDMDELVGNITNNNKYSSQIRFGFMSEMITEENLGFVSVGNVTDIQGNSYKIVKIGDQWWMAENLKVSKYKNGDNIPRISSSIFYWNLEKVMPEGWVNYQWNSSYDATYGKLYSWPVIINIKGLCPEGWHVPSDEEFNTLEGYADTRYDPNSVDGAWTNLLPTARGLDAGKKLKSVDGWREGASRSTDDFGFNIIPGGYKRNVDFTFYGGPNDRVNNDVWDNTTSALGWYSVFWTSTASPSNGFRGWLRYYSAGTDGVMRGYISDDSTKGAEGAYIRCIKD